MHTSPLIEPNDLARHSGEAGWVIVDCRFDLTAPAAGEAAYRRAHIPGARYAHLDHDLARAPGALEGRHPLPEPAQFAARLSSWGIDNDSVVVAYDDGSGAIAARLWWMLRWLGHSQSAVLNGGFGAWEALGLPVQTAVPQWQPARFVPQSIAGDAVVSSAEIAALQERGSVLLDARAAPRYRGEQEPIDPVAGHVPGAVNWPFSSNLKDGRFREPAQLAQDLRRLIGPRAEHEVIAMCGSGVTACHLLLAMAVAGMGNGRLYAGSWSEWIRDPQRPIRTGADP